MAKKKSDYINRFRGIDRIHRSYFGQQNAPQPWFSSLPHTAAACGWQFLHLMPAVWVIQEGHVFVVGGPAARHLVPQITGCQLREHAAVQQVGQSEVVVGGDPGARPTAVLEQDNLIGVVTQTEISNLQQDGAEATGGVQGGATGPGQEWGVQWRTRSRCLCLLTICC